MSPLRRCLLTGLLFSVALAFASDGAALPLVEDGNDVYRVVITDPSLPGGHWLAGFTTAFTGALHPITPSLGWPAEVLGVHRQCSTCGGWTDYGLFSVRSWDTRTDYVLGTNPAYLTNADPGFDCMEVNAITLPVVALLPGAVPGVHATWAVVNGSERLTVERRLRVHGLDAIDSRIEMTILVRNDGAVPVRLGVREGLPPRISTSRAVATASPRFYHVTRPPDEIVEPYDAFEREWMAPSFSMLEFTSSPTPSLGHWYFSGHVIGTIPGLEPAPTPPSLYQVTTLNAGGILDPPGAADACFDWHPPDPPRRVDVLYQMAMVSYWGHDETSAVTLVPGEEARFTSYMVAYEEFPLLVNAGGDVDAECVGRPTRVVIGGSASTLAPTVGIIRHEWTCEDPRVTFTDPGSASTAVDVDGPGTYELRLTASIGAFQTSDVMTLNVVDGTPPRIELLTVAPDALWPPNHQLVPVRVAARAEDACDPAPSVRLVSVVSNEPDERRRRGGDGSTEDDIQGANIGTDDREVLLRAERSGRASGRVYTLTYEATDASGNVARQSVDVRVTHDRSGVLRPAPPRRRP